YSALFTDAENGDYTLPENSFAVDKGVNAHAVDSRGATLQCDLSGKRRIFGASVDLGAYEYSPDAPTAPTITATTLSATSIRVAWDAVSGATSYDVEYKLSSSSTWLTAKSGATQTYFNVSGLASGSKFDFRVCATDEGGTSEFSAVASAWTKPSAPKIAAASPSSATSVAVSWNAVVGANSYTLEYKKSTETSYKSVVSGITTTSTTIADLAESTTYNFRVKAVGYGGESTYSAVKTATLVAAPDPLPTPTITVVAASATALDVVWNAIPNSASYAVEYKLSAAEDWTTATTTATTANFTITELTSGASYDVRAKAVGDGANYGDSAWSAVATTWTTPGAPTITSASATSASEISVAWDAVSGATSYALEYKSSADANWTVYRASVDATSLVVSGLSSGASYDFRVQAVGEGGASAWSAVASAATLSPEVVVLPAPELTAASDATSITLSWTAIAGAKSYTLQYKLASDSTWTNKSAKATETSIVLTTPTLRQGETYDFRLRANGDGGATCKSSPFSAVVSSRIVAKLSTPTLELAGTVVSSSSASATLQWDAIANAKSYSLQYKLATANAWTSASVGASATTFTVAAYCPKYSGDIKTSFL
ncbi:MAG: fibronectin type III domain-containing protein, partial [Thermoguttaceae bacterium]|nr:fibronectin type III domain-containing protein [Thermoguttaceae bacterium]